MGKGYVQDVFAQGLFSCTILQCLLMVDLIALIPTVAK